MYPTALSDRSMIGKSIGDLPRLSRRRETGFSIAVRITDIAISGMALIFFAPLMLVITAFVYLTDPGAVIFAHQRVGRGGRLFKCLKFRSMVLDSDVRLQELLARCPISRNEWMTEHKLRNDPRITPIGKFLRKSSLDELPQLFNVLRGEMSLVGPRPIVTDEVSRYGRYFKDYCRVRPGITGLWQISGRNNVSYRRRVALDVRYVRTQRFMQNLTILALTVPCVLRARGSY